MEIGTVEQLDITEKMKSAYLDYAMSVITARALPDVRDGLKPVQRRILYAMNDMGIRHDRPHRKSARIVGEVLGKYHPHGDDAVYDTMVRMAQDFSMRYTLVDGQGNFGSVDGDNAAAMRYTEARLAAIAEEMLADIDKETVDFADNFDGSLQEPTVLPSRIPNLLLNGTAGIAVGMATSIAPHNLGELADAIVHMIKNYEQRDEITVEDLMGFIPGPDFPTGGIILGTEGIKSAYGTGKGRIVVRSKVHTEDLRGGRTQIVITELPYQVNKAGLIERIATLVRNHKLEGISDLRDESDRQGMRVVIELKRGEEAEPNLEQLFKQTPMENTFSVNMLALVDMTPRLLPLKQALQHFIEHRQQVLTRRTEYELRQARQRAHILEGLLIALDHLDEVIDTIRRSQTADTAKNNLMRKFKLSEEQARAILDMQLRRLAALERRKIEDEYKEVTARIEYLEDLLAHPEKVLALIQEDMLEIKRAYGDARRTHILGADAKKLTVDDLIPDTDVIAALTEYGYVTRFDPHVCRIGKAGPLGIDMGVRDNVLSLVKANAKDSLLFFTDQGQVFQGDVHRVPALGRMEKGQPLKTFVGLGDEEKATAMLPLPADATGYLTMVTRNGRVKRLEMEEIAQIPNGGLQVIGLEEGDTLGWARVTDGNQEIVVVTEQGQAIRFNEEEVRPMGRTAQGVWAIKLSDEDRVAAMDLAQSDAELLIATENGYAKRSAMEEYSVQGRYGMGIRTLDVSKLPDTGKIVAAAMARPQDQVVLISSAGKATCLSVQDVPQLPRASWSTIVRDEQKIAKLAQDEKIVTIAVYGDQDPDEDASSGGDGSPSASAPSSSGSSSRSRSSRSSSRSSRSGRSSSSGSSAASTASTAQDAKPATARRSSTRSKRATTQASEASSGGAQEVPKRSTRSRSRSARAKTTKAPEPETTEAPKATRRRSTRSKGSASANSASSASAQGKSEADSASEPEVKTASRASKRRQAAIEAAKRVAEEVAAGSRQKS